MGQASSDVARANPYAVSNPPKVSASDTRKNHIIIFPYVTENGL
jgi:hypothetical protein